MSSSVLMRSLMSFTQCFLIHSYTMLYYWLFYFWMMFMIYILHHITSCYIILHHITSYHITSYYIILHHSTSYYIILHHITSYYIILYITIYFHILPRSPVVFCLNHFGCSHVRPPWPAWWPNSWPSLESTLGDWKPRKFRGAHLGNGGVHQWDTPIYGWCMSWTIHL